MKLLHIDSSILGGNSVSRQISAATVSHLQSNRSDVSVTYRDLAADPIPHLSGYYLGALQGAEPQHTPALQHDLAISATVLEEFLEADTVVIGVALYNFTVSTQLKAWVDRILVAGKTFRYTADGKVEGLATGKRVILAIARGGIYGPGSPAAGFEHAETYLRAVFGFIGHDVEVVIAEGMAIGPDQRVAAIRKAEATITALAA